MRIAIFCATYLPAYKSGGTVRAVAGLVARLGQDYDFHVFTQDRDQGGQPHSGITTGAWVRRGNATVYYAPPRDLLPHRMARIISSIRPDAYYVNSFLAPTFATIPVILRWLGAVPRRPMLLAPRGDLGPAALRIRWPKKKAFITLAQTLPAYSDLLWQAGTREELSEIVAYFPRAKVMIGRDLTEPTTLPQGARPQKVRGALRLAYLSRITPVKNLAVALHLLRQVRGDVRFSIYGAGYENNYYEYCLDESRKLPANIHVRFEGAVPHDCVLDTLAQEHAFVLPTSGESFGHAIVDALLAGCIPIISNRTRWRGLEEAGVGWDLPLADETAFVRAIQTCVDMADDELKERRLRVQQFGEAIAENPLAVEENRSLLEALRRLAQETGLGAAD